MHPLRVAELRLQQPFLQRSLARRFRDAAVRQVALTFDDGPDGERTLTLLRTLRRCNVRATFFLIGRRAEEQPEIVRSISDAGMEIGSHTFTHRRLAGLPFDEQMHEIANGSRAVERACGRRVTLFRPPYGAFDDATLEALARLDHRLVLWNVDPQEWSGSRRGAAVARRIVAGAQNPSIVVMHDHVEATAVAVAGIAEPFRNAGYRFVTASELA
jgi:peptidoglycan/xylan/chitin deacetylase (PgdA/CDA1 family)